MQHVQKGQKIKSSTINELIDLAQASTFSGTSIGYSRWPTPFIVQARSDYDTATSATVLSTLVLYNNFTQVDGEVVEAEEKTWERDELDSISTLYAALLSSEGSSEKTLSIFSNAELEEAGEEISSKWRLYDLSIDTSTNTFLVLRNYTNTAVGQGSSSETSLDLCSLNWIGGKSTGTSAQIWNYQEPLDEDKVDITALSSTQDYRFIVRPESGGEVQYASLSGILSALSSEISGGGGGGGCSCDLTAYLTSGTKIADWTKDGVNIVEIYAPSGGGPGPGPEPEVSATTLSGNTSGSEKIGPGDLVFEAMASCNISVETTGTTIKLGVYYI